MLAHLFITNLGNMWSTWRQGLLWCLRALFYSAIGRFHFSARLCWRVMAPRRSLMLPHFEDDNWKMCRNNDEQCPICKHGRPRSKHTCRQCHQWMCPACRDSHFCGNDPWAGTQSHSWEQSFQSWQWHDHHSSTSRGWRHDSLAGEWRGDWHDASSWRSDYAERTRTVNEDTESPCDNARILLPDDVYLATSSTLNGIFLYFERCLRQCD